MILLVPASSRCVAGAVIRRHADAARNVHIAFASSLQGSDVVKYHAAAAVRVALLKNRVALLACSCAKHSQKDSTKARSSAVVATAIASRAVTVPPLSGLQLAVTVFPGLSAGSVARRRIGAVRSVSAATHHDCGGWRHFALTSLKSKARAQKRRGMQQGSVGAIMGQYTGAANYGFWFQVSAYLWHLALVKSESQPLDT